MQDTERHEQYTAEARGYAWGAIDFGAERIAPYDHNPPVMAFSQAYADARLATDQQRASYAPSVQDAFANWQASGGRSVLRSEAGNG